MHRSYRDARIKEPTNYYYLIFIIIIIITIANVYYVRRLSYIIFYRPYRRYLNYLFQRYDPHICVSTPCSTGRGRVGGWASRVCGGSIGAAACDVGAWRLAYAAYSVVLLLLLLLLRTPSENSSASAATVTELRPRRPPTRNAPGDRRWRKTLFILL